MRVLIVDDDLDCRLILELMLVKTGWDLHVAANGLDGVAMAKALKPNLILMDLLMPKMSGLEAIGVMRAMPSLEDTAIFAITALAFDHERHLALAAGFDQVITKPFTRRELLIAIQRRFPLLDVTPYRKVSA